MEEDMSYIRTHEAQMSDAKGIVFVSLMQPTFIVLHLLLIYDRIQILLQQCNVFI